MSSHKIKLTKKEKKEIKAVIKKWLPTRWQRNKEKVDGAASLGLWGSLGAVLIGADVVVTGGAVSASTLALAGTLDAALAGTGAVSIYAGALSFFGKVKGTAWVNRAGQTVWSPYPVKNSLERMEVKLNQVFNSLASLPKGEEKEKRAALKKEMKDIVFDAETLGPLIKILDAEKGKILSEEFKFAVARKYLLNPEGVKNADNDNDDPKSNIIRKLGK